MSPPKPHYERRIEVGEIVTCRRARLCNGVPGVVGVHSVVKGQECWRFTRLHRWGVDPVGVVEYRHGAHLCMPCAARVGVVERTQ